MFLLLYSVEVYSLNLQHKTCQSSRSVWVTLLVILFRLRQFCEFWQFKELDLMILMCLFKLEIFIYSQILLFTFTTIKEPNWLLLIIINLALQARVFVCKLSKWTKYHAVVFRQKKAKTSRVFIALFFQYSSLQKAASLWHTVQSDFFSWF